MIGNPYGCIPHPPSAVRGKCVDAEPVKAAEIAWAMDAGFAGAGVQRAASPLRRDAGAAAHCWGQGATPLGRVQGGSACRESKGQRPWPSEVLKAKRPEGVRHFVLGITCRNRSSSGERKQLRQGNKQPNKREGGDRPSPIKSSGYPVTMAARENTASITLGTTIAASTWRMRRTSPGSEPG